MIDLSPRPLPQHRLEQLVHGLRVRMSGSMQKTAAEVEVLNDRIGQLDTEFQSQLSQLEAQQLSQFESSTTEWDESSHAAWDSAELRAYKAIFETEQRIDKLRIDARTDIEKVTAETKDRFAQIEQWFLQAKNAPLKRLKNFRAANSLLKTELAEVEAQADAALAQHSLRVPDAVTPLQEFTQPNNSSVAIDELRIALAKARSHCDRLTHNSIAKFFDSVAWWGLCGLIFVAVTGILMLAQVLLLPGALLAGAAAAVSAIVLGLLGIRPWLKRAAAAEYPRVRSFADLGNKLYALGEQLAVEENDEELKRLAAKRDRRYERAKAWRAQQVSEINRKLRASIAALRKHSAEQKESARLQLTSSVTDCNSRFEVRLQAEETHAKNLELSLRTANDQQSKGVRQQIDELTQGGTLRMHIATQKAIQIITRSRRWCNEFFPQWEKLKEDSSAWLGDINEPLLPVGQLDLGQLLSPRVQADMGAAQLHAPVLFSPIRDGYLTITGDPSLPIIQQLVKNLVMRALTTLPAGKTQVCVIDPPGLGRDFGWLMHLGDFDPQLVSHRVWTQTAHIAKQVNALAMAAEDFIQQSLRNQYQNIVQYNQDAGALAEPYRILVWSSLPGGLDDQSWRSLKSLLDTGSRCGIIPILIIDPTLGWPSSEHQELLARRGLHLTLAADGKSFVANAHRAEMMPVTPAPGCDDEQSQAIIAEVGRRSLLASRVEVPLEKMLPQAEDRWQADSSLSLEIPIGQSGVGRTHCLRLGRGTAQHAIVAGKTGSGKSSLLHAIITSAVLKYSPDRLRLVLLDFKKGVEFQVYSDAKLPHADIIGIESHREFGLSALEYVDGCMQRRGEAFRQAGVQDLASWNAFHPDKPIPRMLVVIDEFQELFVEDDKLSGQASLILDRIVRQGRSFGVHALLSSQTLAGSYSLPRTTLGQMAVRIALQCDPSDAQIIFAEDNPAAARLKNPGQAVYNDAGGRIEGNQPMQIGWLAKQTQVQWFAELPPGYQNRDPSTNRLGRSVVYDGNRAATWSTANADLAIELSKQEMNPEATWCIAGESVAISPAVVFPLTQQTGRSVLLVGPDDPQAAAVMEVINASFVRDALQTGKTATIYVVQGAKPTDARALALPKRLQALNCDLKVADSRGADGILKEVFEIVKARAEDQAGLGPKMPLLLNLIQLGRLRSLRREDDFSMGSFGESELTPDKQLEEILRDGPSHAVHTLIWAESNSTVARWLSRPALREIEVRVLMQMSANDSTNLIDAVTASKLGDHVMLLFDEATGQEQRFRPFAPDTLAELPAWANRVGNVVPGTP